VLRSLLPPPPERGRSVRASISDLPDIGALMARKSETSDLRANRVGVRSRNALVYSRNAKDPLPNPPPFRGREPHQVRLALPSLHHTILLQLRDLLFAHAELAQDPRRVLAELRRHVHRSPSNSNGGYGSRVRRFFAPVFPMEQMEQESDRRLFSRSVGAWRSFGISKNQQDNIEQGRSIR
jgi:hypothetical protein